MSNVLVINATPQETRVASLENGSISDFHIERRRHRGVVGNIYKGRVLRVLPGMQAAFVDIGLEKAGFLYVSDVYNDHQTHSIDDEEEDDDAGSDNGGGGRRRNAKNVPPIEKQLKEGQEILVQVVKDPIGTKGARVTCHVSLAGRNLVFMPTVAHVGISRQIARDRERKRLRQIANEMRPAGGGFIVRTAAEGVSRKLLRHDMGVLIRLWNRIMERYDRVESPSRLYEDLDLILRATRDLATADLDRLVVDSRTEYDRIMTFIEHVMPKFASRAELYVGSEPIFDAYGIESELKNALSRTVQLPSGGYLVIEKTEALTSIDINTGRFVGKKNLEQTIVKTNVEAAHEVAYQLKLRNIGGLVIIDFIDMEEAANRRRVEKELDKAFAGDRGRVKISSISEFGLVELSRKRTRESLEQMLCEPCDHCEGLGIVKSRETVACELLRELHRDLAAIEAFDVHVLAHPHVTTLLLGRERDSLRDLELRYEKKLHVKPDGSRHVTEFDIAGGNQRSKKRSKASGSGRR